MVQKVVNLHWDFCVYIVIQTCITRGFYVYLGRELVFCSCMLVKERLHLFITQQKWNMSFQYKVYRILIEVEYGDIDLNKAQIYHKQRFLFLTGM